jgi:hypothetical protein
MRRDFILHEIALKLENIFLVAQFVILRLKIATEAVAQCLKTFEPSPKFEDFALSFRSSDLRVCTEYGGGGILLYQLQPNFQRRSACWVKWNTKPRSIPHPYWTLK